MNRSLKLLLDITMGALVPILVLAYLTEPLGATSAYLVSALVPVGWVLVDLLCITRRLNVITIYMGAAAIMRGALAFWLVDGVRFALKDTAGAIFTVLVFSASLLAGTPITRAFVLQALNPDTPAREHALLDFFRTRPMQHILVQGSIMLIIANVLTGVVNFVLNLQIVVAPFGTAAFNQQVARVNALTRVVLGLPEFVVLSVIFWLIYRALNEHLPATHAGAAPDDFWERLERRTGA